jgi:N-acetyl-gamma-glutamyl-phosphate reductase
MAIKVGVIGAAGFAGTELTRLLLRHPGFELVAATSNELAGKALADVYPLFSGRTDLKYVAHDDSSVKECEAVFLAVPHTAALKQAPGFIARGVTVIDLSADFRLEDPAVYEQWYNVPHTETDLLAGRSFGLPELFRDDLAAARAKRERGGATLVGCAGCYPTATSLAAAPALRSGLVADDVIVADAISGVSGAGKKANERTHFCFANENVEAYGVTNHRHTPEIEQILDIPGRLVFTPHLAPYNRGLLSTVTLPLKDASISQDEVHKLYEEFYANDSFVKVLEGVKQPKTSSVAGTNFAHVNVVVDNRVGVLVATCAIDNIGKGAAGQALQCANIVFGFDESAGLESFGIPA